MTDDVIVEKICKCSKVVEKKVVEIKMRQNPHFYTTNCHFACCKMWRGDMPLVSGSAIRATYVDKQKLSQIFKQVATKLSKG